ncbi:MAG: ROK family transcriptional regulator [Desulfitobacteriaceae bacterium]
MTQPIEVGSFQGMKSLNKSAILNVIRLHSPISRAEIAKLTKLTPPTVTNLVGELIGSNLVVESDLGVSTGGRKPILLRINSSAFYVVGVFAGSKRVKAVTATLDGQVVQQVEKNYPANPTAEQFLNTLTDAIDKVIVKTDAQKRDVFLGIGVGMHGLVDPKQGLSIFAPNLNLHNIAVKSHLEQFFNLPIEVENDVRALAMGESWFGQGRGLANFICVYVGTGVGASIILDNRLYRGVSYTAGEIGHTTIDINGPKCSCGNYGCLETLAGGPALVRRAQQAIGLGKSSLIEDLAGGDLDKINGELIYQAAQQGDPVAIEVLADTGRFLGIGIANVINTFNPSRIILSGGISRAGNFILDPLIETVEKRALTSPAQAVSIVFTELGGNAMAIGAFTLLLHRLFMPTGFMEEISNLAK